MRAFDAAVREAASNVAEFDAETAGQIARDAAFDGDESTARAAIDEAVGGRCELHRTRHRCSSASRARAAEQHAADDDEVAQRKLEAMALGASAAVWSGCTRGADVRVADNACMHLSPRPPSREPTAQAGADSACNRRLRIRHRDRRAPSFAKLPSCAPISAA